MATRTVQPPVEEPKKREKTDPNERPTLPDFPTRVLTVLDGLLSRLLGFIGIEPGPKNRV